MIKKIMNNIKKNKKGIFAFLFYRIYENIKYKILTDKQYVRLTFWLSHGYKINLKSPKTLNEKIQWLKLYDRTLLHTICADKYKVRNYVKEKIGEEYLVPLYFFTKCPKEINSENLVNYPCIVKTNHNSSGGIILDTPSYQDWDKHQQWLSNELKKNYYSESKEWQYKNIEKGIVVEKLLQTKRGDLPFDYKIHCFNGKPRMIQVDLFRNTNDYSRNWYNCNWKEVPFGWYSEKEGEVKKTKNFSIDPPVSLDKMLKLSAQLSSEFVYSRIDWYDVDGKLFFGEITFHHDSGLRPIEPLEWDYILGEELDLSSVQDRL